MEHIEGRIDRWYVVFWKSNIDRVSWRDLAFWSDFWAFGGYHHVSAFGYDARADVWVHFNPDRRGLHICLIENSEEFDAFLARMFQCGSILRVSAGDRRRFLSRGAFTCVTAVKHLIGRGHGALTANGLFRNLTADKAEIVHVWEERPSEAAAS